MFTFFYLPSLAPSDSSSTSIIGARYFCWTGAPASMNPDDGKRYVINLYLWSNLLNLLPSPFLAITEVFCLLDSRSAALFTIVKGCISKFSRTVGIFVKLTFIGLDVFYCRSRTFARCWPIGFLCHWCGCRLRSRSLYLRCVLYVLLVPCCRKVSSRALLFVRLTGFVQEFLFRFPHGCNVVDRSVPKLFWTSLQFLTSTVIKNWQCRLV